MKNITFIILMVILIVSNGFIIYSNYDFNIKEKISCDCVNLNNTYIEENKYNDTLIFYEIGHIKRSSQTNYLYLLNRIEELEKEVNDLKEKQEIIEDIVFTME